MLALPPFRGVTRRIILTALVVFLVALVTGLAVPDLNAWLVDHAMLHPSDVAHGLVWQLATYPFLNGLIDILFAGLSVWFFGSMLEDERGGPWLSEYFWVSVVGGGVSACLLAYAHIPGIEPSMRSAGLWPLVMSIMLAFAKFNPEFPINLMFVIQIKSKYLAAIYLLIYLASALNGHNGFAAALALTNALCGYAYLQLAPRRGLRFRVSEWWFRLRNSYYRAKRKKAAKKFEVYMRDQGKDVRVDEREPRDPNSRDPNDKRWMN